MNTHSELIQNIKHLTYKLKSVESLRAASRQAPAPVTEEMPTSPGEINHPDFDSVSQAVWKGDPLAHHALGDVLEEAGSKWSSHVRKSPLDAMAYLAYKDNPEHIKSPDEWKAGASDLHTEAGQRVLNTLEQKGHLGRMYLDESVSPNDHSRRLRSLSRHLTSLGGEPDLRDNDLVVIDHQGSPTRGTLGDAVPHKPDHLYVYHRAGGRYQRSEVHKSEIKPHASDWLERNS